MPVPPFDKSTGSRRPETLRALDPFLALTPDAVVVVDGSGVIVRVDHRAETLFAWPAAELVGQPIEVLVPEHLHEVHRRQHREYFTDPHTRPMGVGLPLEGVRRDGSTFPVDISLSTLPTADGLLVIAVVRDMTEQRRSERDAARLAALVRSSDAAMLSVTPHRRIDSWNPGAEVLFGHQPVDILGHDVLTLVPGGLRAETEALYERVRAGERVAMFDAVRMHRDGTEIPVAITLSAMRDRLGAFLGWCEVVRDQTDRLRVQARLATAEAERTVLADRERIARDLHDLVIQRIFAAGMGLQGLAVTLGPDDAASPRLRRIIGELDTAVREIRTSIFTIRRKPGDGESLRGRLIDVGDEMAPALGFKASFDFRGPIDIVVGEGVADAVVAVVREGLANIAKHAQATDARVRLVADARSIRVSVTDNGVGVTGEGRRSGTANLAARAEALGGSFRIDSAAGTGTTITWQAPLGPAPGA